MGRASLGRRQQMTGVLGLEGQLLQLAEFGSWKPLCPQMMVKTRVGVESGRERGGAR